ncbi:terminase small subunit [Gorillibacterium sp. CAU 1737]|uniref:terminase small subunit n=1 Tax=Gorillibacterium sp. CAU 1737 TaxID=3140362 RepID=UPI003260A582
MAETSVRALTKQQRAFVDAYICDEELNATECVRKAYPTAKQPDRIAYQLLENPRVRAEIDKQMEERAKRTQITADKVLQRWWDIATADPNDIMHLRRLSCRYCHGIDHKYQWVDEVEYANAVSRSILLAEAESQKKGSQEDTEEIPTDEGGFGYDRMTEPHPECPKCHGEGRLDLYLADTRKISKKSRLLYAGIKQTQAGIEIKLQDQGKALENVARHLGMFNDKLEVSGSLNIEKMLEAIK